MYNSFNFRFKFNSTGRSLCLHFVNLKLLTALISDCLRLAFYLQLRISYKIYSAIAEK